MAHSTADFPPHAAAAPPETGPEPVRAFRLVSGAVDPFDPSRVHLTVAYLVGGVEVDSGRCVLATRAAAALVAEAGLMPATMTPPLPAETPPAPPPPPDCAACPDGPRCCREGARPAGEAKAISAGEVLVGEPLRWAAEPLRWAAEHRARYERATADGTRETWQASGPDAAAALALAKALFPARPQ